MREWIERLLDHLEWANGRTLDAVRRTESSRALELFAHVLAAERVWLARLRTGDSSGIELWPEMTADECEKRMRENVAGYRGLADSWNEGDLRSRVAYENSEGESYETPAGEILLQVVLHGEHHRGQIARAVRESGGEPANTDFIQFSRRIPSPTDDGPAGGPPASWGRP